MKVSDIATVSKLIRERREAAKLMAFARHGGTLTISGDDIDLEYVRIPHNANGVLIAELEGVISRAECSLKEFGIAVNEPPLTPEQEAEAHDMAQQDVDETEEE